MLYYILPYNAIKGFNNAFIDSFPHTAKATLFQKKSNSEIQNFFKPFVIALFDLMQAYSVQRRSLDVWRSGYLSNAPINLFSTPILTSFVASKAILNITTSFAKGEISSDTSRTLKKFHNDVAEYVLPFALAIIAAYSRDFTYTASYFSQLGLVYLSNSDKVSSEMREICKHSSIILGLSSFLFFPN